MSTINLGVLRSSSIDSVEWLTQTQLQRLMYRQAGYSGTSYFDPVRAVVKFGWDFFLGTEGRAVARNIFLEGNTFQNSRSVVKEIAVADLIVGTELFAMGRFRFGFSLVARTPEFRKQTGMDYFGSIDGTYTF